MKLSNTLAFGALLLGDVSVAQQFQFRPEVLENNTTWPLRGATLKVPDGPNDLPDKCPMHRTSSVGKFFEGLIGAKKPKCKQFDIAAGETLSGFPRFPTRQVHAFTFPNQTYILQQDTPSVRGEREELKKGIWTEIPGGTTITCYEANDGVPNCVLRT
ncbi:uncharacterized protein FTJAE_4879 [Fusarium tjaetaba]|uniref:Uncharacterized protein n=1 Tax=Fusarium tjaetaba TaxID=1567544 RepID=A0A8H5VXW0_9HYPO|nr:uncharacterized protein FTJAE_4879 [Fusarium tjaetaba]KAF5639541.1 hypothetical protein FTJAE_4879 [Fusarium tjaetaba]